MGNRYYLEAHYIAINFVMAADFDNRDIIARDSEGKRPLHFAVHGKGSHGKDVVDVLIKNSGSAIGEYNTKYVVDYSNC